MNIWSLYKGERFIQRLNAMLWRVMIVSDAYCTRALVDTAEEHTLLEEMIIKIDGASQHGIYTSFYYRPLSSGSRFAQAFEPPLWYGSLNQTTVFEEAGYYLRKFHQDTMAELGFLEMTLTAYQCITNTTSGVDLTMAPFNLYQDKISSCETYEHSQLLGSCLRKAGVNAALYYSARSKALEKNMVVFSQAVLGEEKEKTQFNQQFWHCIASARQVEMRRLPFEKMTYRCLS